MTPHDRELRTLLADIGFDLRYYDLVERAAASDGRCSYGTFCEAFADDERFKQVKSERFLRLRETEGDWTFELKLAYAHSRMEMILAINRDEHVLGAPATLLAYEAAQTRDPEFERTPRAPKIPLGSPRQVRETISGAIELFRDTVDAIVGHEGWPAE